MIRKHNLLEIHIMFTLYCDTSCCLPGGRNLIHLHLLLCLSHNTSYNTISDYSMYGIPYLSVMASLLDDLCAMTINISNFESPLFLLKFGVVTFPLVCVFVDILSETITLFWGPAPVAFLPPSSRQNSSDLQHRDEEQDEGAHHDGRCYLLEVDLP